MPTTIDDEDQVTKGSGGLDSYRNQLGSAMDQTKGGLAHVNKAGKALAPAGKALGDVGLAGLVGRIAKFQRNVNPAAAGSIGATAANVIRGAAILHGLRSVGRATLGARGKGESLADASKRPFVDSAFMADMAKDPNAHPRLSELDSGTVPKALGKILLGTERPPGEKGRFGGAQGVLERGSRIARVFAEAAGAGLQELGGRAAWLWNEDEQNLVDSSDPENWRIGKRGGRFDARGFKDVPDSRTVAAGREIAGAQELPDKVAPGAGAASVEGAPAPDTTPAPAVRQTGLTDEMEMAAQAMMKRDPNMSHKEALKKAAHLSLRPGEMQAFRTSKINQGDDPGILTERGDDYRGPRQEPTDADYAQEALSFMRQTGGGVRTGGSNASRYEALSPEAQRRVDAMMEETGGLSEAEAAAQFSYAPGLASGQRGLVDYQRPDARKAAGMSDARQRELSVGRTQVGMFGEKHVARSKARAKVQKAGRRTRQKNQQEVDRLKRMDVNVDGRVVSGAKIAAMPAGQRDKYIDMIKKRSKGKLNFVEKEAVGPHGESRYVARGKGGLRAVSKSQAKSISAKQQKARVAQRGKAPNPAAVARRTRRKAIADLTPHERLQMYRGERSADTGHKREAAGIRGKIDAAAKTAERAAVQYNKDVTSLQKTAVESLMQAKAFARKHPGKSTDIAAAKLAWEKAQKPIDTLVELYKGMDTDDPARAHLYGVIKKAMAAVRKGAPTADPGKGKPKPDPSKKDAGKLKTGGKAATGGVVEDLVQANRDMYSGLYKWLKRKGVELVGAGLKK